jgi:hypothetical protein
MPRLHRLAAGALIGLTLTLTTASAATIDAWTPSTGFGTTETSAIGVATATANVDGSGATSAKHRSRELDQAMVRWRLPVVSVTAGTYTASMSLNFSQTTKSGGYNIVYIFIFQGSQNEQYAWMTLAGSSGTVSLSTSLTVVDGTVDVAVQELTEADNHGSSVTSNLQLTSVTLSS